MAIVTPLISSVFIIFVSISHPNSGDWIIPRRKCSPASGIRLVSGAAPSARRTAVTYGSVSEMIHKPTGYKLSSGRISWGSGSGNQAVTAVSEAFSRSSLWVIKEGYGLPPIGAGEVVNCSSVIRLEHVLSERNLHAVRLKSPISPNYEVSAFGQDSEGDEADNWEVVCDSGNGRTTTNKRTWMKNEGVALKHVQLKAPLQVDRLNRFSHSNCPRCPIVGDLEVFVTADRALPLSDPGLQWIAAGGLTVSHSDDLEDEDDYHLRDDRGDIGLQRPSSPEDSFPESALESDDFFEGFGGFSSFGFDEL